MDKTWDLRDELYRAFHRWPLLVAGFALGALLGWLAAYVWPAYTRSTQTIYVGLNPYRAYSDTEFLALARPKYSNLDNYHYWQMSQLETVIYSPLLLEAVLANLRQQDAAWEPVDVESLRAMLDAEWRSAGDWDLVAMNGQPAQAQQAAQAWTGVVVEQVNQAIQAAQETFMLDERLQQTGASLLRLQQRQAALAAAGPHLAEAGPRLAALPQDQPVDPPLRWQLSGLVVSLAADDTGWSELLAGQPQAGTPAADGLHWLEQVRARAALDEANLPAQIDAVQAKYSDLQTQYQQAQAASWSLSPNLTVKEVSPVHSQVVRPTSTLALIGAALGLLAWVLMELVRITRRSPARG